MEGEEIRKTGLMFRRLKIPIVVASTLVVALLAQPALAFGWTTVIGLLVTAVVGIVGLIIAWIVLSLVAIFNAFLVSTLFCSFTLNPTFYAPGFTSSYAGECGLPGGGSPPDGLISMIRLFGHTIPDVRNSAGTVGNISNFHGVKPFTQGKSQTDIN